MIQKYGFLKGLYYLLVCTWIVHKKSILKAIWVLVTAILMYINMILFLSL